MAEGFAVGAEPGAGVKTECAASAPIGA